MFKELNKELLLCIRAESKKLADRYHAYHNRLALDELRNQRRLKAAPLKVVHSPACWGVDRLFNPFYVAKNASAIAYSVASKIESHTYRPRPPHIRQIAKDDGGTRGVCTYQIPDAAVSLWAYNNLMRKNLHRLSSSAYAYRSDRNAHYAIQDMYVDFKQRKRIFVAEFDFSKFFDAISHEYLREQFQQNGFLFSDVDKLVVDAFLATREVGVPQGTSISLFLANVACWWLDDELEHIGVKFARYADDTVIWSTSYDAICKCYSVMEEFSKRSGVSINIKKSKGISLVTSECKIAEMANAKESIDFLGYNISLTNTSIKGKSVEKIKRHICHILFQSLIKPLRDNNWRSDRVSPAEKVDKDIGSAIHQIRRYLYGNLTETTLRKFERGMIRRVIFKGLMSYYPFVDDMDQLKALDGWLANAIFRFVRAREKMISTRYSIKLPSLPWCITARTVVREYKGNPYIEVPSFTRIHNAIQKGIEHNGPFFKDAYSYS